VLLGVPEEIGSVLRGEGCGDVRVVNHWKLLESVCLMQSAPDDAFAHPW
jgi:hypothetical protein